MNEDIARLFTWFLTALIFALVARALLSWFPPGERTDQVRRFVATITDPLVEPVRRIMPRTGIIDFSTMIIIVLLYLMIEVVDRAADA